MRSTQDLVLYHYEGCGPCARVKSELRELGLSVLMKDIHQSEAALNELISIGGLKQVPCLFVDGQPMYESRDIIVWLRKNFAKSNLTHSDALGSLNG